RLTQNLAKRLHHANNQKRTTRNLQFFLQRILVRKKRLNDIAPKHADVRALLHVQFADEATITDVARHREFIMWSYAKQNWSVSLFFLMPDRFGNLAIKGRSVRHGRRFAANRVGVFDDQFLAVYLFIRWLMANAGIELDDPDSVRAERFDLRCEGFVQSLDDRDHEHHSDDSDAHTKN